MRKLKILLTEGERRSSLAVLRSLARDGHEVFVASASRLAQGSYSRFAGGTVRHVPYSRDSQLVRHALFEAIEKQAIDVIFPAHIYSTWLASEHLESFLSRVGLAVPSLSALRLVTDKWELCRLARGLSIEVPKTACPANKDELRQAAADLNFPCVLKMRRGFGALGMKVIETPQDLLSLYERNPDYLVRAEESYSFNEPSQPIVQEFVRGETHDACLLFNHGKLRAALTQWRIRMYPDRGGRGILNETTWRPELIESSSRLLQEIGWHGLAQVEYRIDEATGRPFLVDVNPRVWGMIDVAIQAGLNFPDLTCRVALGEDVPFTSEYTIGKRYQMGFPYSWISALQSETRVQRLLECLLPDAATSSPFELKDPLPHLAEALYLANTFHTQP